jgi:intein/homing endonuclease
MEWVPLTDYDNGINLEDRPRKLTPEEIRYITDHLPTAPSADSTAAEVARQGIIEWMIETLKDTYIAPSAIPELIQRMIEQHQKSLVVPGTPVGITAAEAVGATTTQMTLNSVAPWERILIQDATGIPHLLKIGDWIDALLQCDPSKVQHIPENRTQYVELPHPVTIASPDENGKVTWEKVTAVTKHLPIGDMVKIITKSGREVTATQSKSLLVWDGVKFVQREGKSVKVGDKVPVFAQIADPPIISSEIDLRKFLSPKEWLYGSELAALYKDYTEYNVPAKQRFWTVKSRLDNLPYSRGDAALEACRNGLKTGRIKPGYIYPKSWGGSTNTMIPEKIMLDKQFGQIVGLYLAEGLCTDTFVGISNNAPEIQDLVYKWCDRNGVTYHTTVTESARGKSTDTNIHSVLFARFFKKWMNTGSANKVMPPEILLGNKEFITGVLDGYFAGDGTVNQRDGYLCVGSASKDIITGFGFLCSRLGIFGKQSGHQPKSNNIGSQNIRYVNTYNIRNKNAVIWANTIGSCLHDKNEKMQEIQSIQKGNTEWGIYYQKHNDVMLDPIVSVELVPASEYVYDLTVPTTTNFSLWNGLGIADTFHASGSAKSASFGIDAMRDLIFARKTPKNESCTIYFTNKNATYEEVLDSRRYIVGSVVSDFILKKNGGMHYDIDSPDVLDRYWWHENAELLLEKQIPPSTKVLRLFLNVPEMFKHRVTIKELAEVLEREVPPSAVAIYGPIGDGIIDLYPHPNIIAETLKGKEKGAIPPELAELTYLESIVRPELDNIRVKGISGIRQLYPIISPVWRIVLLERKMVDTDIVNETAQIMLGPALANRSGWLLFYNPNIMKITGLLDENLAALCRLSGISIIGGTQNYLAISMPNDRFRTTRGEVVVQIENRKYRQIQRNAILRFEGFIYREIDEPLVENTPTGWTEIIQDHIDKTDKDPEIDEVAINVPRDDIRQINDKFYKRIPDNMFIETNEFAYEQIVDPRIKIKELKPSEYVQDKISADKRARNDEIKRRTDEIIKHAETLPEEQRRTLIRKPVIIPRTELMLAAEFVMAETDGSNLKELLALPGIDKTRTTCNNMYTITATLGIEAARTFLIRALNNTIANTGSYVHPANIMFIAEFITSRGEPYGATYTGISRQPGGHLSLATLERAGKVFTQNALHGRKEDIRNVSASVAVGARMAIGDGAFDIAQDIVVDGVPKTIINDDLFTALEQDDTTKELAAKKAVVPAQATTMPAEDITAGLEILKTINAGGTFDFTGAEDEANLITLFNPGEVIPDVTAARNTQPGTPRKVIRRVPQGPQILQPAETTRPATTAEIPHDLIDVLNLIKTGYPLPTETEGIEKITISPLETGVPAPIQLPQPIISTGLIPLAELLPKTVETGFPDGLEALLGRYRTEVEGEPTIGEIGQVTVVTELPRTEIPQLPDLTGVDFTRTMLELRREQVRELEPINTALLQGTLTKQ